MSDTTTFIVREERDTHFGSDGPTGSKKRTYVMILDSFRENLLGELSGSELKVLLCLALHCDESMRCWPSLNTICTETGYSKPTILKALNGLTKRGLVEKKRRRRHTKEESAAIYTSNLYRLKTSLFSRSKKDVGGSQEFLPQDKGGVVKKLNQGSKNSYTRVVKKLCQEVEPIEEEPIEEENSKASASTDNSSSTIKEKGESLWEEPTDSVVIELETEKLSGVFGDAHHVKSNVTQALNIWLSTSLGEQEFKAKMQEAATVTEAAVKRGRIKDDTKRMAYFFKVLRDTVNG